MNDTLPRDLGQLPLSLARELDQVCDRFEDAWLAGRRPRIEEYLDQTPQPARPALLRELLRLEVEHRCRGGDRPAPEEYRGRFPEHDALVTGVLSQVTYPPAPAPERDNCAAGPRPLPSVPGYEIRDVLGQGGMGVVYLARDRGLNRLVALKMILAGTYAGERERARFRTEAEAAARLRHPNIIQVYEIGEAEGRPFLSLEYVEGGSLADHFNGTPQPARQAAELLETLARAVHSAHEQGVIHRDLKPANVLLAGGSVKPQAAADGSAAPPPDWTPKLTDFGLAKQLGDDSGETGSGAILGTPSYMAPEQAEGKTRTVGPAADVYALGAILYEAVTGRPPFKGATVLDTLEQVRSQEPVPPRRLQHKLDRDLETICLKCLQKEPRKRYASALALADDLRRFLDNRPIQARPVGLWGHTVKWARRRPGVAALVAAMVLTVSVATGLVTYHTLRAATSERKYVEQTHEKDNEHRRAERLLLRLTMDKGETSCERGDLGRGILWWTRALELVPEDKEELRRPLRANLAAWHGRLHSLRQVLPHPASIDEMIVSPDGKTLLTVGEDNRVRLWQLATGRAVGRPLEHPGKVGPAEVLAAAFSPDSHLVLTGGADGTARLWDAATGEPRAEPILHGGSVRAIAFGPGGKEGGRTLLTGGGDKQEWVRLWEASVTPGSLLAVRMLAEKRHKDRVLGVAFTSGGKAVVSAGADGEVRQWLLPGLRDKGTLPIGADRVRSVRFSPSGKLLLATCRNDRTGELTFTLWNLETSKRVADLPPRHLVRAAAFSPKEDVLLTGGEDHSARQWATNTGQELKDRSPLRYHQDTVRAVAFGPGGYTLLTGSDDRTARLWDAETAEPIGQPLEHHGPVRAVAFRPDTGQLLTAGTDQTIKLWNAAPARFFVREFDHEFVDKTVQVMAVAWSPDGKTLLAGTDKGKAWRWQVAAKELLKSPSLSHDDEVWVVAFSPDGRTLLTGGRDKTVKLWDPAGSMAEPRLTLRHPGRVRSAAFSPDGRLLLTGCGDESKGEARFWDVQTGRPVGPAPDVRGVVWQVAFSPDGKTFAVAAGDNAVRLWALQGADGRLRLGESHALRPLHQSRVVALAFSPDGRTLLTGSTDKTARLWDVATGNPVGQPFAHAGAVWSVAFSADGRTAVTGCRDEAAHLWDVATGRPIGPPLPHKGVVWAVACHHRLKQVLTGGGDRTVRLWQIPDPVDGSLERLALWAQVTTGMKLDDNGDTRLLDAATWQDLRHKLQKLGGPP